MGPGLFTWQRAIIAADLPEALRLTALRIGLDSTATTGEGVVINDAGVAADVACSQRTVWRRVQVLVTDGWLVQTAKPTYKGATEGGRRARYSLSIPGQSSDSPSGTVADDPPESSATADRDMADDLRKSPDTTPRTVAGDSPSRLPKPAQSSDTTTGTDGTLAASDGSHTAAAAAVSIEILASKLRQTTALAGLRTDKLKPGQAARIEALIEQHGDQRLIDQALLGLRRDNPPQTIQAFLVAWENIPPPGQRLALVKEPPCPEPGHSGTTRRCNQCASEQIASDR